MIIDSNKYKELLDVKTGKVYIGKIGERGNIYDRNGILLVGNKKEPIIIYDSTQNSTKEKIKISEHLAKNIEVDYKNITEDIKKEYILYKNYDKINNKVTSLTKDKYLNREITDNDYKNILYSNITEAELNNMDKLALESAYIYYLMNNGYNYEAKTIKEKSITQDEIDFISSLNNGVKISYKYKRYYPYGNTLKTIIGSIGVIQKENKDEYLEKGYNINDIVGISGIEKYYENYLKATNETFRINANGERVILTNAKKGNDIYLTIDIKLQLEIEEIIKSELIKAKKESNTEFYNKAYAIITDANTGGLVATAGINTISNNDEYTFTDATIGITSDTITPGSIVKGASHLLGYKTGAITFGLQMNDSCIYIKNTPKKCSWKSLGKIDDLTALKYSSNYYQYMTAIKIANGNYIKNGPLTLEKDAFNIYRKFYNEFGLGIKTNIDLPYESIGYIGNDTKTGNILDFPIGQYDTYTPIQISQYITTLANNGTRISPHFLKYVKNNNTIIYEYKKVELNKVNVEEKYIERVQTGLKLVLESGGTGSGYINLDYNPYGKTGTAESFIDTDLDGIIDTETISTSFVGYAGNENKVTFTVLSPNVSSRKTSYTSSVNKRISRKISDLYFQKYN